MRQKPYSDEECLKILREGSLLEQQAVLTAIYQDKLLYSKATQLYQRYVRDKNTAASIFTEAVIAFWERAKDPDFELRTTIGAYIITIGKYKCIRQLTKERKSGVELTDNIPNVETQNVEAAFIMKEEEELVEKAIEKLNENCREKVGHYQGQDKTDYNALAKLWGIEYQSAKNAMRRCRERLRKIIDTLI